MEKQQILNLNKLIAITVLFSVIGCAKPQFASIDAASIANGELEISDPPTNSPQPTPLPSATPVAPGATPSPYKAEKATFLQDEGSNKVDIMIVNDNSFSMYSEQMKMAQRFGSFISGISDLDYRIGMTTTDPEASEGGVPGQLLKWAGTNSQVLSPLTTDAASVFANSVARKETLKCSGGFNCPSSHEEPIKNVIQAIEGRNSFNSDFFRSGADLVVIVLSDEDEDSTGPSSATRPATLVNHFKSVFGSTKKFQAHGIVIRPGDSTCLRYQQDQAGAAAGGSYGTFVAELVRVTNGILGNICADDYGAQLAAISSEARKLLTTFTLAETPVSGSVKVALTPAANFLYKIEGKKIVFAKPPAPGTRIEISYEHE